MVTEDDYRKAQIFESPRQDFLNGIDLGEYAPYIARITYHRTMPWFLMHEKPLMITVPNPLALLGMRRTKAKIIVYPSAFNQNPTFDDFSSCLLDHEGEHAKDIYENSASVINTSRKSARKTEELKAYANQLRRINQRNHSPAHLASILEAMNRALS